MARFWNILFFFRFFLSALNEMEWHCVHDMSNAVLKSMPQSIQEPSLHYLLNWVSSLQLLSIQRLRNWVSSPKLCQHCGRSRREREREREWGWGKGRKYRKVNECISVLPCTHCIERVCVFILNVTLEKVFWQPCQKPRGSSSVQRWFTVIKSLAS